MKNKYSFVFYKRLFFALILIVSYGLLSSTTYANDNTKKQKQSLNFTVIPMHYGLLNAEPHTWNEAKGLTKFEVASDIAAGDNQITLIDQELHASELFVYLSTSGNYLVAQVDNKNGNTYDLKNGLQEAIKKGFNLWNFYNDGSHPNDPGYKAIADFSLKHLNQEKLNNKKHVFIGDSWFAYGTIIDRLTSQLSNISAINKAVHGRTSTQTLSAFDDDFSDQSVNNPDFVWVSLGTNDYWNEPTPLTADEYIDNLEKIITKINALGAKAIVIDSSVGIYDYNADTNNPAFAFRKNLSDRYANSLQSLYQNSSSSSNPDKAGGFFALYLLLILSAWHWVTLKRNERLFIAMKLIKHLRHKE
jgi:lysophospholipase L1-like esterase